MLIRREFLFLFICCSFSFHVQSINVRMIKSLTRNTINTARNTSRSSNFTLALLTSNFMNADINSDINAGIILDADIIGPCRTLNGVDNIRCITKRTGGKIKEVVLQTASAIRKEASIVASKMRLAAFKAAQTVKKNKISFLEVNGTSSCVKLSGIPKIDCLTKTAAYQIKTIGDVAAKNVLNSSNYTIKKVTNLTAVIRGISGFELLSKQIKQATDNMLKNSAIAAKNIKNSAQRVSDGINQAAGRKTFSLKDLLVPKKTNNKNICKNFTGVKRMNCLANIAAVKMQKVGNTASTTFMSEADYLATKIQILGSKSYLYLKKRSKFYDFVGMNISESFFEKASSYETMNMENNLSLETMAISDVNKTIFRGCDKFIGISKLQCIAQSAANIIKTTGNVNAKKIIVISTASALKVYNVADAVGKISGFEGIAKKMRIAAGVFKIKGFNLAKKVSSSSDISSSNIQYITGLQSNRK